MKKIQFIFTFFEGESQIQNTKISLNNLQTEEQMKATAIADLTLDEAADLCKISCCIEATREELPEWYLNCNGKLWFNEDRVAPN